MKKKTRSFTRATLVGAMALALSGATGAALAGDCPTWYYNEYNELCELYLEIHYPDGPQAEVVDCFYECNLIG